MVSTPEGFTDKSPRSPVNPILEKPSARKPLSLFTNILYVKKKTSIHRFRAAKSERKAIKSGTTLWELKPKQKGHSRINYHIKNYIYN